MSDPTIESLNELLSKIIEKAKDLSGKSDLALIEDMMRLDDEPITEQWDRDSNWADSADMGAE